MTSRSRSCSYAWTLPFTAVKASLSAFPFLFGGSLGWLYVVLMSYDSGAYPEAPLLAAFFGWPLALLTDLLLLPFALFLQAVHAVRGVNRRSLGGAEVPVVDGRVQQVQGEAEAAEP